MPALVSKKNRMKKKKTSLSFVDPLCSTCDALSSSLADLPASGAVDALNEDCRSCCTPDENIDDEENGAFDSSSSSSTTAAAAAAHSAILEVSRQLLRNHRHVEEFIKHRLKSFEGRVKVRDRFGAKPRIFLLDAKGKRIKVAGDGDEAAAVRVDHWKTEDIEGFLRERLVDVSAEEKTKGGKKKNKGGGTSTAK